MTATQRTSYEATAKTMMEDINNNMKSNGVIATDLIEYANKDVSIVFHLEGLEKGDIDIYDRITDEYAERGKFFTEMNLL